MRKKSFMCAAACVSAALVILCGCSSNKNSDENEQNSQSSVNHSVSFSEISTPQEMASGTASEITEATSKTTHTDQTDPTDILSAETDNSQLTSEENTQNTESDVSESLVLESNTAAQTEAENETFESNASETSATSVTFPDDSLDNTNVIVSTAETLIGIGFVEGGDSPETGFDNSGFIYYVLRQNGYINCPRMTAEQSVMGVNISAEEMRPGDLVFFSDESHEKAAYGGIYTGGGKMIYCPMPGQSVKYVDITTEYWASNFYCAVSLN